MIKTNSERIKNIEGGKIKELLMILFIYFIDKIEKNKGK